MKIVGFTVITHMTLKSDQESLKENEPHILELLHSRDIHLGSHRNNIHCVKHDLIKTILLFQLLELWEAYCIFQITHILNQQVKNQQSTPSLASSRLWLSAMA